jgi:alpha-glucosidase
LWSLFERASALHEPIIRPTFYDFPNDENCFSDADDFMLGAWLLVAPVVTQGQTERQVYLPKLDSGQVWFDFETGQSYEAGMTHTVQAPMNKLPLFARQGAVIDCAAPEPGQVPRFNDPVVQTRKF